ncbi:MAG: hypothetical protein OEV70_10495 [Nitrospirota bacterium]|nr:hypothetical protein [Nitrospirota bacterium]
MSDPSINAQRSDPPRKEGHHIIGIGQIFLTLITKIFSCYFKVGEYWCSNVVIGEIVSRWVWEGTRQPPI